MVIGELNDKTVKQFMEKVVDDRKDTFKLNLALGYILRHIESGELRFFYPSQNSMLLDLPILIDNRQDIKQVLEKLSVEYLNAHVYTQLPSTKWLIAKIICLRFDTFKVTPS